jgi:hypothetical protein
MNDHQSFPGVMVSSTFTDLTAHRAKLIEALNRFDLHPVVMESSVARAGVDVLQSSLDYVTKSAAYICVLTHKYGQIPPDTARNPQQRSLTELEFNEARRLDKPRLLFLMGEDHPVKTADVETDPIKREKLAAFRARAKTMRDDSEIHCVYSVFNSLEEFAETATAAVGHLAKLLDPPAPPATNSPIAPQPDETLPRPPSIYARPGYAASHRFVGRAAELQTLSDWSAAADPNPMLLFEAIGGTGKSMLTWQFLAHHAITARPDWAGRFWYSFYEKGANMSGFCRHALAYLTGSPPEHFDKQPTHALAEKLLAHLQRHPYLLVLDGIERILVAYHSIDAASQPDEAADTATDRISNRKPRQSIRPDDDDLLVRLAAAAPSKILVSTRLTPLCLINKSDQPIAGVRRESLGGLRPPDAEAMLTAQRVTGNSAAIQAYLQTNCDCNPLVIGALAGLINKYRPDPGNFDRWSNDPAYGANLNLSALDVVPRRNHILAAAIESLPPSTAPLLHILALLPGGADHETLSATLPAGSATLNNAIDALEEAGLLQYDRQARRYDLHPVVRGFAVGRMTPEATGTIGRNLVEYFAAHGPKADVLRQVDDNKGRTQQPTAATCEFFLSYSTKDEDVARRVVAVLESAGKSVFALFKDIPIGSNFVIEINRGLRSNRTIALLSPAYESSKHCQAEWSAAYAADPDGSKRKLIPLLIKHTELQFLARQVVYANLVGLEGTAFDQRVIEAINANSLAAEPISNIVSPIRHAWVRNSILTVEHSALPHPHLGRGPDDFLKQLSTVRKLAMRLVRQTSAPEFNHSHQYCIQLQAYIEDLPHDQTGGNVYLCDAAARTIRELFDAEKDILSVAFSSPLKTFLECHIGLRAYYPELAEFYASVRDGILVAPLPLDAVEAVRSAIEAHTPTLFDPVVGEELGKEESSAPEIPKRDELPIVASDIQVPSPPPDPIGTVDRAQSRDQLVARSLNGLWSIFLKGKDITSNIEAWRRAYESLEPAIRPILEHLRRSLGT